MRAKLLAFRRQLGGPAELLPFFAYDGERGDQGSTTVNTFSELSATLQEATQKHDLFGALLRVVPREKDDWMKFLDSLAAVHNSGAIDLVAEFGELRKDGP